VHDDLVDRVGRVVLPGSVIHGGAEPDQLGDLRLPAARSRLRERHPAEAPVIKDL
jgi:hypothetical protein